MNWQFVSNPVKIKIIKECQNQQFRDFSQLLTKVQKFKKTFIQNYALKSVQYKFCKMLL
jgi:hypothetical protein